MPDWCFNNLMARGAAEQLEGLREAGAGPGGALDFERVDPTPPELLGRRPDPDAVMVASLCGAAEAEDPYSWRGAHWGCTRPADPDSVRLEDSEAGALSFRLSTPWSPPEGIAATLAARFPALEVGLAFFHPARGFAGAIAFEGGREVNREERELDDEPGMRELVMREFGVAEATELLDPAA